MLSRGVVISWCLAAIGCAAAARPGAEPAGATAARGDGDRMVAAVVADQARCPAGDCERACQDRGDGKACALAAELYLDGKYGHPFDPALALRHATRGCELGEGYACALLGQQHEHGTGTPWAPDAAIAAYDKACAAGSGYGCLALVVMYNRGHGVDVDRAKARTYLTRARKQLLAACQGSEPQWCAHAALALDRDDPATKATLVALEERACARGAVASCVDVVADRARRGGRPAATAWHQLEQLCTAGEGRACSVVAALLAGRHTVGTAARALTTMIRACELGHRDDCVVAGTLYERGLVTARDDGAKRAYFARGCERGSGLGCLYLARDEFTKPGHEASFAHLAQRACELGEPEGCAIVVRNQLEDHDDAAADRWAAEGCRRRSWYACQRLVARDLALPELTAGWTKELYQIGCADDNQAACQRLARLAQAEAPVLAALRDALVAQDAAAFARLAAGDVALHRLRFDSAACTQQFSGDGVLTAAAHVAFLRCLAPLGVHVEPHASVGRAPALVYEPGVVLSLDVRDGVIRGIAAPRLETTYDPSAPTGPAANRTLEPIGVEAGTLDANRIAGERLIVPTDATKRAIALARQTRLVGTFKLCLNEAGEVKTVALLKSTGFSAYDAQIQHVIRSSWTYTPFWIHGRPAKVCTAVTFVYSQR